jgi:cyclophilin family peptidyl-prolyl cis-trans isomerase/HEAT repeat protein
MIKTQGARRKSHVTRERHGRVLGVVTAAVCLVVSACASAPVAVATPEPPVVSYDDKLSWILRLEDQRLLRDPNPPPPVIIVPATRTQPAIVAPPPPSDLIRLLSDGEARVRRRAALAAGRVGLPDAVEPLTRLLADGEPDVRQMAAFALGLIGDAAARPALLMALSDTNPLIQGRAAEALGLIGNRADADAISTLVRTHVAAGAVAAIEPDDLTYPQSPPAEAVRLGLYALVRLGSYEALAAAALDAKYQPVSSWWPVAYALQRLPDPRSTPALLALLRTPGRYTAAFAARGLGVIKAAEAAAPLREIVERRSAHPAVVIQALRALAAMNSTAAAPVVTGLVTDFKAEPTLRLEAATALSVLAGADSLDLMLDLISDQSPIVRGLALRTLARIDPDALLTTLSGLDAERDWTVRAAEAASLAILPPAQAEARLRLLLKDPDFRVVGAAMTALIASKPPWAATELTERLNVDDFAMRAAAARGLGELKVTPAVPALVQAYRVALGDSTYVARGAILEALAGLDAAAARPLLEEALRDKDWAIRVRASELLERAGVPAATTQATIRPAVAGRAIDEAEWQGLVSPAYSPHAYIATDRGGIEIELTILDAPLTVGNFIALARKGFFDGIAIHRIVPDFVVQDGDPRGDGEGGPGYTIRDEINTRPYLRGTVGMALDWADTGGSQFFITHSPQPHLDGRYTVFGNVVAGMDVVDRLGQWDVVRSVTIWDGVTPPPLKQ